MFLNFSDSFNRILQSRCNTLTSSLQISNLRRSASFRRMKRKVEALGTSAVLKGPKLSSAAPKSAKNVFVRSYEHVDGNWPSLVYMTGKFKVDRFASLCWRHYALDMPQCNLVHVDDPHLSLSKSFVLRSHQIQPFILHLGNIINSVQAFSTVLHSSYQLLVNDNQTRLFLALPIEDTNGQIARSVKCVDEALTLFRQPMYYADPKFHISFASHLIPLEESKLRENILNRINTQPTTVSVGADFMQAHHTEQSTDLEESDDESDSWLYEVIEKRKTDQTAKINKTQTESKTTVLGGLLAGYESDSSDDNIAIANDEKQCTNTAVLKEEQLTVPALSKVITFDAVECKIGNRLFRLDLCTMGPSKFYEVLPPTK